MAHTLRVAGILALLILTTLTLPALAATPDDALPALSGADLPLLWVLPFAGLLLSIALVPLFAAQFWHEHYGKITAAWVVAFLIPFAASFGTSEAVHHVAHAILLEYVPFIAILFALFTIAGGICLRGTLVGTPALNTDLLALGAARDGALAAIIDLVTDRPGRPNDLMVFWTTGVLSALLDNAPTYLVFFNLAGGDPAALMGPLRVTLTAISMGAVYFGALTYIGNAPNFMIKAIAEDRGVAMPSFFAYFAYASAVMLPLLVVISVGFF